MSLRLPEFYSKPLSPKEDSRGQRPVVAWNRLAYQLLNSHPFYKAVLKHRDY